MKLIAPWLLLGMLGAPPSSAALGSADPVWAELHRDLIELQRSHRVPALMLVLFDDGRPVLVAAHGRDGRRLDPATPFRWGSISKTVTALTLLEAVRRAGIPLTTPVAGLLDPLPYHNPWAAGQPLRVAQLAELSAGLPDLSAAEFAGNEPLPLATALARGAAERRMLWPPGLQHGYSNVVPGISAAVIERLTGTAFEDAARSLLFEPLGMTGASFLPVAGLPGGFRPDGSEIPYWHVTFRAFGGLNASPAAMARLLEALLGQGRLNGVQVIDETTVARLAGPRTTLGAAAGLEIGYGSGLYGWVRDGHLFRGHGGDADGYLSRLGLLTEAGRGYLLGIDVDDPALFGSLRRRVEQALGADLAAPLPPPAVPVPQAELAALAGEYYPASTRFDVTGWQAGTARRATVQLAASGLEFHRGGQRQRLVALGGGRFRRPQDPAVSVVFVTRDGQLYLQGELGNYARIGTRPCAGFLPVCRANWPSGHGFGKVMPAG